MGYLDKEGLSYFWRKVRTALSGKQEQLTPDESLVLDGGNISVKIPTRHLTRAEYNALTEEEKQADAVYLVDEPQWVPVPLSIQEYDTEDGWHVRQWSDGYIEMALRTQNINAFESSTGGFLRSRIGSFAYPVPLTAIYSISAGTGEGRTGGAVSICFSSLRSELEETPVMYALATDDGSHPFAVFVSVTGRWK